MALKTSLFVTLSLYVCCCSTLKTLKFQAKEAHWDIAVKRNNGINDVSNSDEVVQDPYWISYLKSLFHPKKLAEQTKSHLSSFSDGYGWFDPFAGYRDPTED